MENQELAESGLTFIQDQISQVEKKIRDQRCEVETLMADGEDTQQACEALSIMLDILRGGELRQTVMSIRRGPQETLEGH